MKLTVKQILSVAVLFAVIGAFILITERPWEADGSVAVGNGYQSTTTPQVAKGTNLCPAGYTASSTHGILGTVNILKTGNETLVIYDATTTDITKRNNMATSSLIIAAFAGPLAVSYNFDATFKYGLLVDYETIGVGVASSTFTYRCNE